MSRFFFPIVLSVFILFISCGEDDPVGVSPEDLPAAPTSLVADSISHNTVVLQWEDNSTNEDGFCIERKLNSTGDWYEVKSTEPNVITWTNTDLIEYTDYNYRVFAFNSFGNSDTSAELTVRTSIAPAANLTTEAVSPYQIDLSWHDRSDKENGFLIERKTGGEDAWMEIADVEANQGNYSDTDLTPSTAYSYRICAYRNGEVSIYSNETSTITHEAPLLIVEPESITLTSAADTSTVSVSNGGGGTLNWSVTVHEADQNWLTITSASSGINEGTIVIQFDENPTDERTGEVIITAPGATGSPKTVTVTQTAHPPILTVSACSLCVESDPGIAILYIVNEGGGEMEWSITEDYDWFSANPSSGSNDSEITVNYDANSGNERIGELTITAPEASPMSVAVNILQNAAPPTLLIEPDTATVDYPAGNITFWVRNDGGGIMDWTVFETSSWLTVVPTSGSNDQEITVEFDVNMGDVRMDELIVVAPDASPRMATMTITQAASPPRLSVTPDSLFFDHNSGNAILEIQNTGFGVLNWTVNEEVYWFSVDPMSGTDDEEIMISYTENQGEERQGEIIITAADALPASVTVCVTQGALPPILVVEPDSLSLGNVAWEATFSIRNDGGGNMEWTLTENAHWFSLNPTSGVNDAEITITYDRNSGDEREEEITVNAPDASPNSAVVKVAQDSRHGSLQTVDPDHARQDEFLTVTITGRGTHFRFLSEHGWSILQMDDGRINGYIRNVDTDEQMQVDYDIPRNAETGYWDVVVGDGGDYEIMLREGFRIDPR